MPRAERRHHEARTKAKVRRKFRRWGFMQPTARQVGQEASRHFTCPCRTCTHKDPRPPEKFKGARGEPT